MIEPHYVLIAFRKYSKSLNFINFNFKLKTPTIPIQNYSMPLAWVINGSNIIVF